ncbi:ABC transporter ATP-binding protein, partial [Aestuariivirga sp.]|uniref:ABC transporter ATP-binding protein n=2 Tax=Aestuariivirga sp. TaxID=2650926 RepID=UPI00301A4AEC
GGQQQRVAIARAIVTEPKLLLLDEPLSNLDAKLRDRLRIELRALQKRLRLATIYVTHDQAEAMSLSDRVAFMSGGRILEVGTPQEIYRRPRIRQTAEFIGEANIISGHLLRRENGRPIAQTPFGEVDITGETEGMEGDVLLCIRPEDIRLGPAERGALTGRVSHVAFMGALSDYIIAAPGGLTLRVQVPGPALAQAGESVTIALPATAPVIRQSAP